ncbi:MAG: ABC transporter substrate-binding protein [Oscillospiraceae bacterium]|nr:ABC transporter substrate-binding protein [Oscillospiraceae bacterium]
MKKALGSKKMIALVIVLALAIGMVAGCAQDSGGTTAPSGGGGGDAQAPGTGRTSIRVGYVGPLTGPQALFTVGIREAAERALAIINDDLGGIYFEGYGYLPLEMFWGDSETNSVRAAEVADRFATVENVDFLVGQWTPLNAIPVSIAGERHQIPTLAVNGPAGSWLEGGPYEWAHGIMFNLQILTHEYFNAWDELDTNRRVGLILDASVDGVVLARDVAEIAAERGYTVVDPGRFPEGTTDFTAIITELMNNDVELLVATLDTPGSVTLWTQMLQLGFEPTAVVLNRGMHFASDVGTLGGEFGGTGLTMGTQWAAEFPFTSSLSGQSAAELSELFTAANNRSPDLVVGWDWAIFDILHDVFTRAESLEPEAILHALHTTDLQSAYGHIRFNEDNVSITPIVLGQWIADDTWGYKEVIVSSQHFNVIPSQPIIPLPWSQ